MTGSLADAVLRRLQAGLDRAQALPLVREAVVTEVREDGTTTVRVANRTVVASLATEEPIRTGEIVWTGRTAEGTTIIHGGRR